MSKAAVRLRLVHSPALTARRMRQVGAVLSMTLVVGLMVSVPPAGATASDGWIQRGGDIDGEAAKDLSGRSVALSADGLTVAIGAPGNNGVGGAAASAGHVRIYQWTDTGGWIQRGGDIDGEAAGDNSGRPVALSADGNTVAIGAHRNNGVGGAFTNAGHVRVYQWSDAVGWIQRGGDIDGEAAGDNSGRSLALSADGNTVAIGAHLNNGVGGAAGHVRVYQWSDAVGWIQRGSDIDGEAAGDNSGTWVALSADGNTVAIGAHLNNGAGGAAIDAGHVRVYQWSDAGGWIQRGSDIDGEEAGDNSGRSLALSADGNTVAIGAHLNNGAGGAAIDAGHVRVYQWSDAVGWIQRGSDIDGEEAGDLSGNSVALSADGNTVAIGGNRNNGVGGAVTNAGHVRVYQWSDADGWTQRGSDIDGEAAGDNFGTSVALSADGDTVAIGAHQNDGTDTNAGHVRVFTFAVDRGDAGALPLPPSVSCVPAALVVGGVVTCTVTGGDAGIDILWRAAYNPVIAEAGVTLDASGMGTFSFTVPSAALGQELTVELVEWIAPVSLGVVSGPVPTSVPSGEGPVPMWSLGLLELAGVGLLRRGMRAQA